MPYLLGVDIGTTSTAAAISAGGPPEALPLGSRGPAVPTVVLPRADGSVLVGDAAERRAHETPDRVAREFKRRVGDSVPLLLGGSPYPARQLMAMVLSWVVDRAGELRGGPPDGIVVSHPANWSRFKTEALLGAFAAAGLPTVDLLTEPQAAALHFASTERIDPGQMVAVYDLGGGTFDAAVLRRTEIGFEPVGSPEGIESLGGMDFDEAVLGHVRRALGDQVHALDAADPSSLLVLHRAVVEAKEGLSDDVDVMIPVRLQNISQDVVLRRYEFEEMIRPSLELTVDCLERTLERADVSAEDLAAVVLAGGSSRIPLVRELVGTRLGRPVILDHQPQLAVALGTVLLDSDSVRAVQADAADAADTQPIPGGSGAAHFPVPEPAAGLVTLGPVAPPTSVTRSGAEVRTFDSDEDGGSPSPLRILRIGSMSTMAMAATAAAVLALATGAALWFGRGSSTDVASVSARGTPTGAITAVSVPPPASTPATVELALKVPTAGGWIGSADGVLACGTGGRALCSAQIVAGTVVDLEAHMDPGHEVDWAGACIGNPESSALCRVDVGDGAAVTVAFPKGKVVASMPDRRASVPVFRPPATKKSAPKKVAPTKEPPKPPLSPKSKPTTTKPTTTTTTTTEPTTTTTTEPTTTTTRPKPTGTTTAPRPSTVIKPAPSIRAIG